MGIRVLPGSLYLHACSISKHSMQQVFSEDKKYLRCLAFAPEMLSSVRGKELHPGPIFIPGLSHSAASERQRPSKVSPAAGLSQHMETSRSSFWSLVMPPNGWPTSEGPGDLGGSSCRISTAAFVFHPQRPALSLCPVLELCFSALSSNLLHVPLDTSSLNRDSTRGSTRCH